jgi:hypothetical protein
LEEAVDLSCVWQITDERMNEWMNEWIQITRTNARKYLYKLALNLNDLKWPQFFYALKPSISITNIIKMSPAYGKSVFQRFEES